MTSSTPATDAGTTAGGAAAATVALSPVLGPDAGGTVTTAGASAPEVHGAIDALSTDPVVAAKNATVLTYQDKDGRVHYASPHSKATKDRVASGQWVEADEQADQEAFDPTGHLVREVVAHLEEHAGDEAEVQRVKDAEAAGEDRPTIASWSPEPAGD